MNDHPFPYDLTHTTMPDPMPPTQLTDAAEPTAEQARNIEGDFEEPEYTRLKAQKDAIVERENERLRDEGRKSVVLIRCINCLSVPQQNKSEITEAECGGCIAKERDAALARIAELERENAADLEKLSEAVALGAKQAEEFDAIHADLERERDNLKAELHGILKREEATSKRLECAITQLRATIETLTRERDEARAANSQLTAALNNSSRTMELAGKEIDSLRAQLAASEKDRELILPIVRDFVQKNPKHDFRGVEQDPWGSHALLARLERIDTAIKEAK